MKCMISMVKITIDRIGQFKKLFKMKARLDLMWEDIVLVKKIGTLVRNCVSCKTVNSFKTQIAHRHM